MQCNANDLSSLYASVIAQQQRLVVKVGTYVLTDQQTGRLNEAKIEEIVNQAAALYHQQRQIAIVTSGAVGVGKAEAGIDYDAKDLPLRQALAAIGQPKLMELYSAYFARHGIKTGQFLASYDDLNDTGHKKNFMNTVKALYSLGGIPILNENDPFSTKELETTNGSGEIKGRGSITFGDNDLLSVMASQTLEAQVLFLLSEEKGLMDYASKSKLDVVEDIRYAKQFVLDSKSKGGTGGMKSKLESIAQATDSGIFVVLLSGLGQNGILRVMHGEPLGTLFLPKNFKYTA